MVVIVAMTMPVTMAVRRDRHTVIVLAPVLAFVIVMVFVIVRVVVIVVVLVRMIVLVFMFVMVFVLVFMIVSSGQTVRFHRPVNRAPHRDGPDHDKRQ